MIGARCPAKKCRGSGSRATWARCSVGWPSGSASRVSRFVRPSCTPAYASRAHFRFVDPARQLRFVTLLSDLKTVPLGELTRALAEGRVRLDGQPYAWEAELMIFRPNERPPSLELAPSAPRFTLAS